MVSAACWSIFVQATAASARPAAIAVRKRGIVPSARWTMSTARLESVPTSSVTVASIVRVSAVGATSACGFDLKSAIAWAVAGGATQGAAWAEIVPIRPAQDINNNWAPNLLAITRLRMELLQTLVSDCKLQSGTSIGRHSTDQPN